MRTEIDRRTAERINVPVVYDVYSEWKRRGILEATEEYIELLPDEMKEPIIHSLVTHVHKEKGLFVDIVGEAIGVSLEIRKALAMSADTLWAISLMIDDIEDGDIIRGGVESCWAKYGQQKTVMSAALGVRVLIDYLDKKIGSETVAPSCLRYIESGMQSLKEHKLMNLHTSQEELFNNYYDRCDFHGTFQLDEMFSMVEIPSFVVRRTIDSLRIFNSAGQLINDLKDFTEGDIYGRSFSDIRRGVPTVPLIVMFDELTPGGKNHLERLFGKGSIEDGDRELIQKLVIESGIIDRVMSQIIDRYSKSIDVLEEVVHESGLRVFRQWADYKVSSFVSQLNLND